MGTHDASPTPSPIPLLIVDDRAENIVALKAILSSSEYRIVVASSGKDALRALLEDEFAALLVDVLMPEMNGFALAAAIKERERTAAVPILFLTAQATDVEIAYRGYRAGAVDYLIKPLNPDIVRAKVAVFAQLYCQRKRIEQQAALLLDAERKDNELRLVELSLAAERRYRALAEAMPQIVWTAGPEGNIDYFNRRWFEHTGLTAEDTASAWDSALHPLDLEGFRHRWAEAARAGDTLQAEVRLRTSDGTFRWQLCRAIPERGATGQIAHWLGTFTDIEDQKRAAEVLSEFKATLDAVLDAIIIVDPENGRFLYVNQGASALLGYSRDELMRMRSHELLADQDAGAFRDLLTAVRAAPERVYRVETHARRRDARTVPCEVSLQLIRIDGGRVLAIVRDIADRQRARLEKELLYRQAVEALHARDEFLSVASHELRAPLSALRLQVEMLARPWRKDPEAVLSAHDGRPRVETVATQVDRLSRLVDELLDVSRIAAGRLHLSREEVDLAELVTDVVARTQQEGARAQCSIEVSAPSAAVGLWDRMRIEQVVTNLLTNAMKFGAGRPIEVEVRSTPGSGRLVVRDHGIGIAPEDVERIFERYEQVSHARAHGGLGLGLYIVRQIVDAHGGTIRVESEPRVGTAFFVELPRQPPAAEAPPANVDAAAEPESAHS